MATDQTNPGVLVLYPLRFTSANYPVISDPLPPANVPVGGLAHSTFTQDPSRREGATQVKIDPPSGGEYDAIALYMKTLDDPQPLLVERKSVAAEDQNSPTFFNVFQSLLVERVNIFFYVVERSSGNDGPSIASWALYHHQLPGGNDVPGTGAHPYLMLSLPPELGNPPRIGKEEAAKGVPLTVSYPHGQPYDNILLMLNGKRFTFTLQPGEENRPYVILLTQDLLEQAGDNPAFEIRYTVISQVNNPTDRRRESHVIVADVDLAHTTLDAPLLREDLDDSEDDPGLIDRDKLKGGPLWVVVLPRAPTWQVGDTVQAIYRSTPPDLEVPTQGTVEKDGFGQFKPCLMPVPNDRVISGSQVRVAFELVRNGQVVGRSKEAMAQVMGSGEEPGPLKAPRVPAFDDGLVTDADARIPVEVLIPTFNNALAGDEITVLWGSKRAAPVTLLDTDLPNDPIIGVKLLYALVESAGQGPIDVKYEFRRSTIIAKTSPVTPVVVDLSIPGGPDPDPETPENENLRPNLVLGASKTPNVITPQDFELDATATLPWRDKTGNAYMVTGDIVQVFWGTQSLAPYPVKSTDAADLVLPVLQAIIALEGSGDVPVRYTVTRKLATAPHEGVSRSPVQNVSVLSAGDLPGGVGGLGPGVFTEANADNAIGRAVIEDGSTPLRITNYLNMKVEDKIELFFIGIDNYAGTGNEIEASRFEPTHEVVVADMTRGYVDFPIPALNILHICTQGSAKVKYRVTAKVSGAKATSREAFVLIDVKLPHESTCPIPPRR
ncbi:hypothetical protein ABH912_001094 [Pseudomonas sp. BT76 TE3572]|uniref:hypothetical protein n=1 Tax=Pseudomonas sp. BT76 TE3572 TaxID=3349325 RepID=UPI003D1D1C99